jgi:DNA-binding CsgD family transcriptional regulator
MEGVEGAASARMEPLETRDFHAILRFLEGVYAVGDADGFAAYVTRELSSVVRCDLASYNELNHRRRRIQWVLHGADRLVPDAQQIFADRVHENPVVVHNYSRRESPPVKTTDFISQREFRQRGIYTDFYGPMRLDHVMVAKLPSEPWLSVAVATLRSDGDFTERERRVLAVLQPHLIQAYRNAEFLADHRRELSLLREGIDELGLGVIVLAAGGQLRAISMQARLWLAAYFGATEPHVERLPDRLNAWIRDQSTPAVSASDMPTPRAPLIVERDGKRLVIRALFRLDQHLVLLDEHKSALHPTDLRCLGLSPRESEVLAWVALGKTNGDVGAILDISPRTVQHTLERIYGKLGVHTRAAATARAVGAARDHR